MSVSPRQPTSPRRRTPKNQPRQPNRAQLRAMEVRAAGSRVIEPTVAEQPAPPQQMIVAPLPEPAPARPVVRRPVRAAARPIVLDRATEYRFIRSDLNRLLTTASALLLVMLALLFIVDR